MHIKNAVTLGVLVFMTAGCSGGSEDFPSAGPSPQPAPTDPQSNCGSAIFDPVPVLECSSLPGAPAASSLNALPGGYWSGTFVDETQVVQGYVTALVSEDGRFQMNAHRTNENNSCYNWEAGLAGTMTVDGNAISGSGRLVAVVPTLADGTRAADLQIEGGLAERSSMTARWNSGSGDAGCFVLNYDRGTYEEPSALANLAGEWRGGGRYPDADLSVAADGSLTGTDSSGCSITGYFGLIDDRYSLYEFEADYVSCARAGHYSGLAWHGPGWDPGEFWLQVQASDGARALTLYFSSR